MDWRVMVVLLLLVKAHVKTASSDEVLEELELPKLSIEEEMEVERQFNLLNKPAVKSIKTEDGDIFDCVDIHKQPAFDHPLLKNHTLQTFVADDEGSEADSHTEFEFMSEPCPFGTVPIRRVRKEDLIRARFFKPISFHENYSSSHEQSSSNSLPRWITQRAMVLMMYKNTGASARFNVYGLPDVSIKQSSASLMALHNKDGELQALQAGWMVQPALFGDSNTRLFIFWTGNNFGNIGCYNIMCAGFVQTDSTVALGGIIKPVSRVGGRQYWTRLNIMKGLNTGDWWFYIDGKAVGYWPKILFANLALAATEVKMGGIVNYREDTFGPPMGNGHMEPRGPLPCFIDEIQLLRGEFTKIEEVDYDMTNEHCYRVNEFSKSRSYFGGPAGCH